jgi:hypothetical protein
VVRFLRAPDGRGQWSGLELNELAEKSDPTIAQALKEQIASGFYGKEQAMKSLL